MGQLYCGTHDGAHPVAQVHFVYERLVDLDHPEVLTGEVLDVGIPGTVVVDGEVESTFGQGLESAHELSPGGYEGRFGDFERDAVSGYRDGVEHAFYVGEEILRHEMCRGDVHSEAQSGREESCLTEASDACPGLAQGEVAQQPHVSRLFRHGDEGGGRQ